MNEENLRFVVCINNEDYPASLELNKIYHVVTDSEIEADGEMRIIDESGEDYIYPAEWFVDVNLPVAVRESVLRTA